MFYAFYMVVESIIMYTYFMYPLLYAPWTSSLDGYVRNINVAIIINIISKLLSICASGDNWGHSLKFIVNYEDDYLKHHM